MTEEPFTQSSPSSPGGDGFAKLVDAFDFEVRHGRTGAVRFVDEEVCRNGRDDPACLGHAIPCGRASGRDAGFDLVDQIGRHLRPAARKLHEAGGIGLGEVRVIDQFPPHDRHAAQARNLSRAR
jgi:hypothetical protein